MAVFRKLISFNLFTINVILMFRMWNAVICTVVGKRAQFDNKLLIKLVVVFLDF